MTSKTVTGSKRFVFRLITLGLGLVVGLAAAEIVLRVIGYSSPQFYEADDTLGYKLIPGMSGWYTKEGRNFVTINSDGFNDVEHVVEKPSDVFRIAVIGDSYVEAFQVGRQASFTNFIDGECGIFGGKRIEVLNFGVSGYGTAQQLILLREKVMRYAPDLVMLVMTTNNDISDNVRELKQTPIPYYVIKDGKLVLDDSFRSQLDFITRRVGTRFENNLRFVQAIREISRKLKDWNRRNAASSSETNVPVIEVGTDSQVYREPANETWLDAWQVTEALILEMNRETNRRGARFIVVTASNGAQVLPNIEERNAFARLLGVNDLYYPDRRIAEFCRANSISVITLAPILAEYAAREQMNLHGFEVNIGYGHWNQLGHRVAGEAIRQRLCEGK
jgi:hypothetical protein